MYIKKKKNYLESADIPVVLLYTTPKGKSYTLVNLKTTENVQIFPPESVHLC